jgi:hypothetical protein
MELDPKDARAVERAVSDLRAACHAPIKSVVLWGEAASDGYRPRRSPLSLAVVVERVDAAVLRALARNVAAWKRARLEVPLLFDPEYLERARDVFPLELLDLIDRHRVLHGDDPFATLEIDVAHLRTEVEEQLRGKMLHLWDAYLAAGGAHATLRRLLTDTPPAFEVVMRGMLRLRDVARPNEAGALIAAVERAFDVRLEVIRRLEAARHDGAVLRRNELESLFGAYLEEVRALVGVIDAL